ncbi:hypothetical protein BM43_3194 [Burkholderia gladioli]|uniref:hypothetical protein n=1 Tax=Burkholderia gladioli TaxID=28095 RepID=UPI0005A6E285|nr:hypothetical protein [Burkholderia gladioli]AJW97249.1 hypothetical protein BM43_3194 [Burkholderia gladioli]ASD79150.1 hypothetical protein CEJ98_09100 [Burkholderia gladioli pv. gladioli]AWY55609.1 hypothetical protein A8H28_32060 [Burkholderia gladioli pv. gladioli]SPU87697.1 Uncharacterised protein [Burkholderia gladioli]
MKRLLAAGAEHQKFLWVLAGCAVMAAPPFLLMDRHASPSRDIAPPYVVKAITAENGVPCVMVLAGATSVAISCDWGSYDAPSDTAAFRSWHHSGKVPS